MAGSPFRSFVGGYARSQSPIANCATLQNLYVQGLTPGSKSEAALYPTPGYQRFGQVAQVGGKRYFSTAASNSRVFSITGMRLYEWFFDGSALERGTVAVDANPATIYQNGKGGQQLAITAGGNFYSYDLLTNTLTEVAFLVGKATQCGFISGYFLVFDIRTGTVYQSDLYDGLTFDPANFFQRNTQADDWVSMLVTSWGRILLLGSKTRDSYANVGTFPIPFAPTESGVQTEGNAATFSLCEAGGVAAWLGTAGQNGGYKVYAASGYRADTISTEAIDFELSRVSQQDVANATGETYTDQGHDFLELTVGDTTFCFDFQANEWHTRRTFVDAISGQLGAKRARWHCFGFNKHLWLDATTGVAYESDIAFPYDVDGLLIQRQRTTPSIRLGAEVLDIGEIELVMQVGVGNANEPGMDPVIGLEISGDGGMTWGPMRLMPIGRDGKYMWRVRWQSNGIPEARDVAFRVTMSDPIVNYRLMQLLVELFDERGRGIDLERMAA